MLNKIKNFIIRFMAGRYGYDRFSKYLMNTGLVLMFLSLLLPWLLVRRIIYFLAWLILLYAYFRVFSKNISARYNENQKFESKLNYYKQVYNQRKTHRFYNCPKCKTHLRVPKGVGKVTITCTKCGHQFDRKAQL